MTAKKVRPPKATRRLVFTRIVFVREAGHRERTTAPTLRNGNAVTIRLLLPQQRQLGVAQRRLVSPLRPAITAVPRKHLEIRAGRAALDDVVLFVWLS